MAFNLGAGAGALDLRGFQVARDAAGARLGNAICGLAGRRMADFRWPALRNHAAMRFGPSRKLGGFLAPMHDGGFVAPVEEPRHGGAMRAGNAEGVHGLGFVPGSDGPKGIARFAQYPSGEKSGRAFGLGAGLERVPDELRKIEERTHPQAGHGHENHSSALPVDDGSAENWAKKHWAIKIRRLRGCYRAESRRRISSPGWW